MGGGIITSITERSVDYSSSISVSLVEEPSNQKVRTALTDYRCITTSTTGRQIVSSTSSSCLTFFGEGHSSHSLLTALIDYRDVCDSTTGRPVVSSTSTTSSSCSVSFEEGPSSHSLRAALIDYRGMATLIRRNYYLYV